jgi:diguanylate cyclase (GGDEF)-like protein
VKRVLVVEDTKLYAKALEKMIYKNFGFNIDIAKSAAEVEDLLSQNSYDLAVVDLVLPDSQGEHIESILEITDVIVMTSLEDEATRKKMISLKIVDYVVKSDSSKLSYLRSIIHRYFNNESLSVLVVDDSKPVRTLISSLLNVQQLKCFLAEDGQKAVEIFENEKIDLIITDYQMPNMDGMELVKAVRKKKTSDELPIIILSSVGEDSTIARFLKAGANDYITKPFSKEEFFCRINLMLNNYEMFEKIKKSATTDFLTSLRNRSYIVERIEELQSKKYENNSIALIDIDKFKNINDTYGHHTGDIALKHIAKELLKHFKEENVLRFGGEEFLIIFPDRGVKKAIVKLEVFRKSLEKSSFQTETEELALTVSIGVSECSNNDFEKTLNQADVLLYEAKENGRNRIEFRI